MADPRVSARWLAAVFVVYGLLATAFLALNVPPFQNPDEPGHFSRAAFLADGGLVGTRFSFNDWDGTQRVLGGGAIDPSLLHAWVPFSGIALHPDIRATASMWTPPLHWSAKRVLWPFQNTVVNPPFFYLPSAAGVLVGRLTRMTVLQTLVLSRMLTGTAAIALGAVAIAIADAAAVWLFAILTLPMSFSLLASSSQDALLLGCGALAGALLVRDRPGTRAGPLLAAILILVATARPPFGALALLPLGLTRQRWRWRIAAAAAVVAGVLGWSAIAAATGLSNIGAYLGADPGAQLARLRGDPLLLARATWNALSLYWRGYLDEFVGHLGWLDTALPPAYHVAARIMLVVAALAAMLGLRPERIGAGSRLLIAAGVLGSAAGVFAIEFVTWTVPGHATVEGVEGRYFLPLALVGAGLLPALGNVRWVHVRGALVVAVAAFPVVSLAVMMRAVVLRYYLG